MTFLDRIFKTKKGKKIKRYFKKITGSVSETAGDIYDDVKNKTSEKLEQIDDKINVSEKINTVKDKITETAEKVGDKIESYLDEKISFDTFSRVEIKIGEILEVEKVEKSKKLLKLKVDLGEKTPRQIISGIAQHYENEQDLKGKQSLFVTNLEPREIFGLESDGMILVLNDKENFTVLNGEVKIKNGTKAG